MRTFFHFYHSSIIGLQNMKHFTVQLLWPQDLAKLSLSEVFISHSIHIFKLKNPLNRNCKIKAMLQLNLLLKVVERICETCHAGTILLTCIFYFRFFNRNYDLCALRFYILFKPYLFLWFNYSLCHITMCNQVLEGNECVFVGFLSCFFFKGNTVNLPILQLFNNIRQSLVLFQRVVKVTFQNPLWHLK